MDLAVIQPIAEWLAATAPWGALVVVGYAFWKINERKDKQLIDMHERLIAISETQILAISKVESALQALKSAIEGLARR